ncbi:MAG: hypothetical protein L3J05_01045 [Robiginitomaculum sp.]|nr:hypothetical protein [Robiginitomaculum sp.]
MRDRFFYPLLVLVIAGVIALGLLPGIRHTNLNPVDIIAEGYSLSGTDLQKLTAAPGTEINFVDGVGDLPLLAVLSSNNPRRFAPASAGVFGTLGPNYEAAFGGHSLEITITARAGRTKPLDEFKAGYFTVGAGDSGWKNFTLSEDFADYSFTFKTNPPNGKPGNDFVGIWPGDEGKGDTMELKSISIEVLQ